MQKDLNRPRLEEKLINFDTAVLAKEKGFDAPTFKFYYLNDKKGWHKKGDLDEGFDDDFWGNNTNLNWNSLNKLPFKPFFSCVSAPTQSLLQKWLREVHNIEVLISIFPKQMRERMSKEKYYCFILNENWNPTVPSNGNFCNTYEEAFELGLQEALKLI